MTPQVQLAASAPGGIAIGEVLGHTGTTRLLRKTYTALVIGGGPAGLALAVAIGRRGWQVEVLEARDAPQRQAHQDERGFNITLSEVGRRALGDLGADAARCGVRIVGRAIHHRNGGTTYHRYGLSPRDYLTALPRGELIRILLQAAEATPGVVIRHGHKVVDLDIRRAQVTALDGRNAAVTVQGDYLFGADGAGSISRHLAGAQGRSSTEQHFHDVVYLSVQVPAEVCRRANWVTDYIHFAPSCGGMDVGISNPDGTATLLLMTRRDQRENRPLASRAEVEGFLRSRNPALWKLVPDLEDILLRRRPGGFVTTSSAGWVSERLVLLGDAAHAQPAYVGQGVNSALADCAAVTECLDRFKDDVAAALKDYEARRATHSRCLKRFCHRHGQMLLGGSFGNWRWRWADWLERLAERVFGRRTLYQRIVFDCEQLNSQD